MAPSARDHRGSTLHGSIWSEIRSETCRGERMIDVAQSHHQTPQQATGRYACFTNTCHQYPSQKMGGCGKMKLPLYRLIAMAGDALRHATNSGNEEWQQMWQELLEQCEELLPSGSGFDAVTSIVEASSERIVLLTSYHHMNEHGHYEGWTNHTVTVVPSLAHGFDLKISGRNKNDVKEYIADVFDDALRSEVIWDREKVERVQ